MTEDVGITGEEELSSCPRQGYVELAVDEMSVLFDSVGGEEVELVALLDGERVDDHIAL